jgi:hypothetical protein
MMTKKFCEMDSSLMHIRQNVKLFHNQIRIKMIIRATAGGFEKGMIG